MTLGFSRTPTSTVPPGPYVGISLHAVDQHFRWPAAEAVECHNRFSQWKIPCSAACCQNSLTTCCYYHYVTVLFHYFPLIIENSLAQAILCSICIQRYARNQLDIAGCLHDQLSESWCHSILVTAERYLSVIYSFLLVRNQWKLQFAFLTDVFRCQEVDQRGHGEMLCKKLVKHIIWTGRMLWIVADGRSW